MKLSCPNCGDNIIYMVGTNSVYCKSCNSTSSISNLKDINLHKKVPMDSKKYICSSCGNVIISIDDNPIEICNYCGSIEFSVESFNYSNNINKIIPFRYNKKEFINAFKNHIRNNEFSGIRDFSEKNINSIKGMYIPVKYSLYEVNANAKCVTNSSGGIVSINNKAISMVDGKGIEFNYDSTFRVDVPFDLTKEIDDLIISSIHPYDLESVVDFSPYYVAGFSLGNTNDVFGKILKNPNEVIKDAVYKRGIPERFKKILKVSDFNWNIKQVGIDNCVFVPVWLCNYTFDGQKYEFVMNGQTGKVVAKLPINQKVFNRKLKELQKQYDDERNALAVTLIIMMVFILLFAIISWAMMPFSFTTEVIIFFIIIVFVFWYLIIKTYKEDFIKHQNQKIKDFVTTVDKTTNNISNFEDRIIINEYKG